jgi:hypothetical protein
MRPTFCIIALTKQSDLPQQRQRNASSAITFQSAVPRRSRPPVQSGEALAFSSWTALIIVLSGTVRDFLSREIFQKRSNQAPTIPSPASREREGPIAQQWEGEGAHQVKRLCSKPSLTPTRRRRRHRPRDATGVIARARSARHPLPRCATGFTHLNLKRSSYFFPSPAAGNLAEDKLRSKESARTGGEPERNGVGVAIPRRASVAKVASHGRRRWAILLRRGAMTDHPGLRYGALV